MIVLVCGSRDWTNYSAIYGRLSELPGEHEEITIIHGAASRRDQAGRELSADMLADEAARRLGFSIRRFPADWSGLGKRAGFARNIQMLDERPDRVLAFQRDRSRGTQHTIDQARRRGIPVEVMTPEYAR